MCILFIGKYNIHLYMLFILIIILSLSVLAKAGCLSFAYNMFGRNVNKLSLYAEGPSSGKDVLWSKEGNQGSDWLTAKVDITATEGMKVNMFMDKNQ